MFSGYRHYVPPPVADFEEVHAALIDEYIALFDAGNTEGVINILQTYLDTRKSEPIEEMRRGFREITGFFGVKTHPESEDLRIRCEHLGSLAAALRSNNSDEIRRLLAPDERRRFSGGMSRRYKDHLLAIVIAKNRIAERNRAPVRQDGIELKRL